MTDLHLRFAFSLLVGLAVAVGLTLAIWEHQQRARRRSAYASRNVRLSLSAIPPNVVVYVVLASWWAFIYRQAADLTPHALPVGGLSLLAAFFACDLSYYVEHRCGHRLRILWRMHHGTHHSSDLYNIPLAYRVNCLTQFTTPLFYLPWLFLGFHPLVVLGFQLFVFHYQAWIHTEHIGRLGLLDRYLNTPAVHRMHHSNDPAHRAVNLGGVTMLWDRLFGTYAAPRDDVEYGVAGAPATQTYAGIYLDPWRQ